MGIVGSGGVIIPDPGDGNPLITPGLIALKDSNRDLLLAESTWKILRQQDVSQYMSALKKINQSIGATTTMLAGIADGNKTQRPPKDLLELWTKRGDLLVKRLDRGFESLVLLLTGIQDYCPRGGRTSRAPFSFVGSMLHSLFGTMDEEGQRLVNDLDMRQKQLIHIQEHQASVFTGALESFSDVESNQENIEIQLGSLSKKVDKITDVMTKALTVGEFLSVLEGQVNELLQEVDLFEHMVERSVGGSVPRNLVPDTVLQDVADQFVLNVDKKFLPSLMETQDVYKCGDVLLFFLELPVPGERQFSVFRLYTPSISIGGSFLSFILPQHIAVPLKDPSIVISFAPGELGACKRSRTHYLCYAFEVSQVRASQSCAIALMDQNSEALKAIPELCHTTVSKGHQSFFHYLPRTDRLIFSTITNNRSILTCGSQSTYHDINGTGVLSIPASCTLQVGNTLLKSPRVASFPGDALRVNIAPITSLTTVLNTHVHSSFTSPHSSDLATIKLHNATVHLMHGQMAINEELGRVDDLSQTVGAHGVRDVTWLSSISGVVGFTCCIGLLMVAYRNFWGTAGPTVGRGARGWTC